MTHRLASDAAKEEDLNKCDDGIDNVLADDEELCVLSMSKALITFTEGQQMIKYFEIESLPGTVASSFGTKTTQWIKVTTNGKVVAAV
jgi:hypothetical protein